MFILLLFKNPNIVDIVQYNILVLDTLVLILQKFSVVKRSMMMKCEVGIAERESYMKPCQTRGRRRRNLFPRFLVSCMVRFQGVLDCQTIRAFHDSDMYESLRIYVLVDVQNLDLQH